MEYFIASRVSLCQFHLGLGLRDSEANHLLDLTAMYIPVSIKMPPTMLVWEGHSSLNWSLAYATATLVAITVMAEPVIATLLAIPILNEWPSQTSIVGGILILTGIYIAVRSNKWFASESRRPKPRWNWQRDTLDAIKYSIAISWKLRPN
jgi:drug/metabolite transporter (DMT)-like permease